MTDAKTRVSLTDSQKATITSTYTSGAKTQQELATEFGCSMATVNKLLKGVTKPEKRKYTSVKNADRNAEVMKMHGEGKTLREIAHVIGCTHQNISLILKKNGVDPGEALAERNAERSAASEAAVVAQREEKQKARMGKLEVLSKLWKDGATVEEIRVAGGLKSIGAANVKIVLLRKKFPLLFPLRGHTKKTDTQPGDSATEITHSA
jgi:transcriptional regulator with XRE-family HTH domain